MHVPMTQRALHLEPVSPRAWGLAITGALFVFAVAEVQKVALRARRARQRSLS
jgi:hypothetical protein